MSSPVISLKNVFLTLSSGAGPVEILKDISFDIYAGETVGIVGPSGSGKSSLMSLMTGLERPTAGSVTIAGMDMGSASEDTLASHRLALIGIVMQAFHLVPTMTALENVAIPLELAGDKNAFAAAKAELGLVGLAERADHYPSQLSGGEQQRVALARALVAQPAILFGDEPTGNLDSTTGEKIVELIFRLASERGSTLVLITHDTSLAAKCDRVITVSDGRILSDTGTSTGTNAAFATSAAQTSPAHAAEGAV